MTRSETVGLGWLFLATMVLHVVVAVALNLLDEKNIAFSTGIRLILSELTILVPSLVFILHRKFSFREDLGFRPVKAATVLMSVLFSALITPVISFVNLLSQFFVKNEMLEMSDTLTGIPSPLLLFLGALYGPFCEEFLFRGIFFERYDRILGPVRAGLVSSLLFGLAHMKINQALYAFVLGFIMATVNRACGSIFPSMIIHMCINGGNLLLLVLVSKVADIAVSGPDIVSEAEAFRISDGMYVMAGVLLVISIVCTLISIPCVVWMSKHEGRFEDLYDMFANRHDHERWLTLPMILGLVFVLFVMFGLEPVLSLVKGGM